MPRSDDSSVERRRSRSHNTRGDQETKDAPRPWETNKCAMDAFDSEGREAPRRKFTKAEEENHDSQDRNGHSDRKERDGEDHRFAREEWDDYDERRRDRPRDRDRDERKGENRRHDEEREERRRRDDRDERRGREERDERKRREEREERKPREEREERKPREEREERKPREDREERSKREERKGRDEREERRGRDERDERKRDDDRRRDDREERRRDDREDRKREDRGEEERLERKRDDREDRNGRKEDRRRSRSRTRSRSWRRSVSNDELVWKLLEGLEQAAARQSMEDILKISDVNASFFDRDCNIVALYHIANLSLVQNTAVKADERVDRLKAKLKPFLEDPRKLNHSQLCRLFFAFGILEPTSGRTQRLFEQIVVVVGELSDAELVPLVTPIVRSGLGGQAESVAKEFIKRRLKGFDPAGIHHLFTTLCPTLPSPTKDKLGFEIGMLLIDKLDTFNPSHVCEIGRVLVSEELVSTKFHNAVAAFALQNVPKFQPTDLASLVAIFTNPAVKVERGAELLALVAWEIQSRLGEFDMNSLANVLYHFTAAQMCSKDLLESATALAKVRLGTLSADGGLRLLWACAKGGQIDLNMSKNVATIIMANVDNLTRVDILKAFWTFVMGQVNDVHTLEDLLRAFLDKRKEKHDPADIEDASLALAFAFHGNYAAQVLETLAKGIVPRLKGGLNGWTEANLASLMWAMGVKYAFEEEFFAEMLQFGKEKLPLAKDWRRGFRAPALNVQLAWSLARAFHGRTSIYAEMLGPCADHYFADDEGRRRMMEDLGVRRYFRRISRIGRDTFIKMTVEHLSQLIWAFGAFRFYDEQFLQDIEFAFLQKMHDIDVANAQVLADAMWGFAVLKYHSSYDELLNKAALICTAETTMPALATMAFAATTVGCTSSAIFQPMLKQFLTRPQHVGESIQVQMNPVLQLLSITKISQVPAPLLISVSSVSQAALTMGKYRKLAARFESSVFLALKSINREAVRNYLGDLGVPIDAALVEEKKALLFVGKSDVLRDLRDNEVGNDGCVDFRERVLSRMGWSVAVVSSNEWEAADRRSERRRLLERKLGIRARSLSMSDISDGEKRDDRRRRRRSHHREDRSREKRGGRSRERTRDEKNEDGKDQADDQNVARNEGSKERSVEQSEKRRKRSGSRDASRSTSRKHHR